MDKIFKEPVSNEELSNAKATYLGDFVLAHAYLRDDNVLDAVLPPEIPIPPIAAPEAQLPPGRESEAGRSVGAPMGPRPPGLVQKCPSHPHTSRVDSVCEYVNQTKHHRPLRIRGTRPSSRRGRSTPR